MISRSLRPAASDAVVSVAAITATAWIPIRGMRIWLRIDQRIGGLSVRDESRKNGRIELGVMVYETLAGPLSARGVSHRIVFIASNVNQFARGVP